MIMFLFKRSMIAASMCPWTRATTRFSEPGTKFGVPSVMPSRSATIWASGSSGPPREWKVIDLPSMSCQLSISAFTTGKKMIRLVC